MESPPPQLSASQLPSGPSPPLPSLPSKLHAQPDVTLLLLSVELGAVAPPYASAAFLAAVFPESWRCFEKCQKGGGRHNDIETRVKNFLFLFIYC